MRERAGLLDAHGVQVLIGPSSDAREPRTGDRATARGSRGRCGAGRRRTGRRGLRVIVRPRATRRGRGPRRPRRPRRALAEQRPPEVLVVPAEVEDRDRLVGVRAGRRRLQARASSSVSQQSTSATPCSSPAATRRSRTAEQQRARRLELVGPVAGRSPGVHQDTGPPSGSAGRPAMPRSGLQRGASASGAEQLVDETGAKDSADTLSPTSSTSFREIQRLPEVTPRGPPVAGDQQGDARGRAGTRACSRRRSRTPERDAQLDHGVLQRPRARAWPPRRGRARAGAPGGDSRTARRNSSSARAVSPACSRQYPARTSRRPSAAPSVAGVRRTASSSSWAAAEGAPRESASAAPSSIVGRDVGGWLGRRGGEVPRAFLRRVGEVCERAVDGPPPPGREAGERRRREQRMREAHAVALLPRSTPRVERRVQHRLVLQRPREDGRAGLAERGDERPAPSASAPGARARGSRRGA